MNTQYTTALDGTRIAFNQWGTGPAIILIHGGGSRRQEWQEAGYVERLLDIHHVIVMDLRGHGESGQPTEPAAYTEIKMYGDILSVANACEVNRFSIWGMSFGGKVSRYLAAQSDRLTRLILMSTPLGPGVTGQHRREALDFCAHWAPIMEAQRLGIIDPDALGRKDREFLSVFNIPAMLGWVRAMLDWPSIEPADFLCPTLWLVGSEDPHAMSSVREFKNFLPTSMIEVQILDHLDHEQVFSEIDTVSPLCLRFQVCDLIEFNC